MGRAIYYCVQCSKRVSDTDLESGKAFRVGERILCKACAPESAKSQTSKKITPVSRPRNSGTSVALKNVTAPIAVPPAGNRKRLLLQLCGAGLAFAIGVLIVILLTRGSGPPAGTAQAPDPPKDGVPPSKPDVPAASKESSAKGDLDKARQFAAAHPEDLVGRLREFTDITWKWEGSDSAREAVREVAAVKASILEKVVGWMAELEQQIEPLVKAKQYYAAVRKIEELKPSHDLAEWRLAAEKRASELFVLGKKVAEGEEAKKPDEKPAPGVEDKAVAKPLTEEAKGYLAKWEAAAARATARDFAGAIADMERSASPLKEADVKQEAEDDVAALKKAAAVFKESMDYLRQRPRGAGISLGYRDGSGAVKRAGGAVLQIDAERVEVRSGKDSVFVEWNDVTASTLAEVAQRGNFDPRTLAILCLLEGEIEPARAFKAELPPRWWTYAEGARARIPKPDPGEKNARDLYAAAEKGYRSMETRAAAVEKYKTLRAEFTSTSLVKSYSERIFLRSDAGKEYYFPPADFHAEGTIRLVKSGKLESSKDSDDRDTILNFAELEFAVLPGLTYRCWIWIGACCEETFLFYYQGSELTDVDSKKKKTSCEPGSNFAVAVKPPIRNLKKTHEEHKPKGAKVHPKTAARWEWVEIVLPKYSGPGGKKLRFMTNQAGFSIAGAVVSSSRKGPPLEPEIKDLDKTRAQDEPPTPVDPDLVGWWGFDEGAGDQVVDLSGKNHTAKLVGDVKWVDGKIGGAIQGAGGKSGIEVADAEDLRITGDMTLALWVRRAAESGDWVCVLGRGTPTQRNYGIWLEANNRKYMYQQYGSGADINVYGQKLIETGKWIHLAVTIERDMVRVYYNGAMDTEQKRAGPPWALGAPLGIGYAMQHTAFNGSVDDVRIYRRALNGDEIRGVFDLGK